MIINYILVKEDFRNCPKQFAARTKKQTKYRPGRDLSFFIILKKESLIINLCIH